jgi:hypothetical protein
MFVYFQVKVIDLVTWFCLHLVRIAAILVYTLCAGHWPGHMTFTSHVIGRRGHVTMTWRSVIGRGRGHVTSYNILQSDWSVGVAGKVEGSVLTFEWLYLKYVNPEERFWYFMFVSSLYHVTHWYFTVTHSCNCFVRTFRVEELCNTIKRRLQSNINKVLIERGNGKRASGTPETERLRHIPDCGVLRDVGK